MGCVSPGYPPCADPNCARYGCFLAVLAEPPHGRVGANDAVEEAVCQRYHGMSRAEWNALPDATPEDD